ncbi:MAG: Panacea domain-containing protein [Planctomycetota bacterium]
MTMFPFKFKKALQAAAYLLRREPSHDMSYMRLLKVLYLADRESVRLTGRPITGDRIAAMEQGPVLSDVYNLIKGEHLWSPDWAGFILKEDYKIRMVNDPGQANLSRFEIETLERIAEECRSRDEWEMVQYAHEHCPEWEKNKPSEQGKMNWIPFKDLLEAVGRSADQKSIEEDAREEREFARLFGD